VNTLIFCGRRREAIILLLAYVDEVLRKHSLHIAHQCAKAKHQRLCTAY
jgi:hypothetical protein